MIKYYYTDKQMKQLEDAIPYFKSIRNSQYKRTTPTKLDTLVADILDETLNTKVNRSFNCSHCVYELYKKAGNIYFDTLDKIKEESITNPIKSKKGRKASKKNNE